MDASDTTPGGSSTTTHKRTKSAPRVPSGPNPASLFLTNLRLLNLDTLADWPSITPSTFSNVDARARIKAAEWSLYQLFRISDPATTAEKLQPFFPPLEPLQSINLRAALYRCLDGLKKSGILGRDVVLRKTMLDELQTDRCDGRGEYRGSAVKSVPVWWENAKRSWKKEIVRARCAGVWVLEAGVRAERWCSTAR